MNSRRRTITSISMVCLAVAILSVSALGQNAYAAMSLSVDADYDNGNISVSGDTDRNGDVTIKVTAENGNLVSVDQVTPSGGTSLALSKSVWMVPIQFQHNKDQFQRICCQ